MPLTADKGVVFEYDRTNTLPVAASAKIYKGAAVGDNGSGFSRSLQAGDPFEGFCLAQVDNTSGAAGAREVQLQPKGRVVLNVTGVDGTDDIGKAVFASDDSTFTTTEGTNSYIGRIIRHESGTQCVVQFDATRAAFGSLTQLVNNSGGTPGTTIAAIGGTYAQAEVANAIATLATQIIALQKRIK